MLAEECDGCSGVLVLLPIAIESIDLGVLSSCLIVPVDFPSVHADHQWGGGEDGEGVQKGFSHEVCTT